MTQIDDAMSEYEAIEIKFRGLYPRERYSFRSQVFKAGDVADEMVALIRLWDDASKKGLTPKDVIKIHRRKIQIPRYD